MKKKIISIILSFFLFISTSVSSFASETIELDNGIEPYFIESIVLAPELIAMIGTVAVGAGIYLENKDDLYDVARLFYERNASNWDNVLEAFGKCAVVSPGNMVKVGSQFLEYCKSAFDEYFLTGFDSSTISSSGLYAGMPYYEVPVGTSDAYSTLANKAKGVVFPYKNLGGNFSIGDYLFKYSSTSGGYYYYNVYLDSSLVSSSVRFGTDSSMAKGDEYVIWLCLIGSKICMYFYATDLPYRGSLFNHSIVGSAISVPNGTYEWDKVEEKADEEGKVLVGVPGNAVDLIGEGVDVFNPTYGLTDGTVTLPDVVNPSISVGESVTLPVEGTVTGEGTGSGSGSIAFPSFGDSIDFSPFELSGITEKFPFSLPWDLGRLIKSFDVDSKAPVFDVPIVSSKIKVDLTQFDDWANIVRWFITISLIITLIYISVRLKG